MLRLLTLSCLACVDLANAQLATANTSANGTAAVSSIGQAIQDEFFHELPDGLADTLQNMTHVRVENISTIGGGEMPIKRGILQRVTDPFDFKDPWYSILYLVGDIYVFFCLHIVVHSRFAPAMEKIVELSDMNEDVAGATLLAIGTSLPEVLSGVVGVFVPGAGDTGLGTVVGSLVFNMLVITGSVVAFFPKERLRLSKSATIRDICFQIIVILMLVWAFSNKQADLMNVVMFLLLYVVYIFICAQSGTIAHACHIDDTHHNVEDEKEEGGKFSPVSMSDGERGVELQRTDEEYTEDEVSDSASDSDSDSDNDYRKDTHEGHGNPLANCWPPPTNPLGLVTWVLSIPLVLVELLIMLTIPDVLSSRWKRCQSLGLVVNLAMSALWLGILVLFMIQWATKLGELLGIPPAVMGLTFCAAGTSVPDLMVSLIVAKQGKGNMAISNVFGSNVFDILIAMAVPWALSYSINGTENLVKMEAEGFNEAIAILASVLLFYVFCVCIFNFKLPRKCGWAHLALYVVFVIFVFVRHLEVFKEKEPTE